MYNKYVLLLLLLCVPLVSAYSQTIPGQDSLSAPATGMDSLQIQQGSPDSLNALSPVGAGRDSLQQAAARKSDIETTINYSARDSIRLDFRSKTMHMYSTGSSGQKKAKKGSEEREGPASTPGNAKIDYGQIKLEAAYISTNWETNMLSANGVRDSTGRTIGKPLFTDGPEQFVTDEIKYNFKSRKAVIKGIVTQQQDGYIHGETVKKTAENELLIEHAMYTTCNLEDPHFHIAAERLKRLPNGQIISGPFHLRFADIPTPLGFLFGMFPPKKERASGIIIPTYGEERRRGFFLRNGGYYTAINDYIDLAVTGEIYTKGSRGIALASNYRKRYAYNGNFNIRYNRQDMSENEGVENISKDMWVTWSHAPQSKGKGRFTASVNGGSTSYTTNNPSLVDPQRNLNQTFSSNVNYSYSNIFNSPFSVSARANMNQNVATKTVTASLPDVGVSMTRQFPFKKEGSLGKTWYEQIGIGYSFNATNKLSNTPIGRNSRYVSPYVDPSADSVLPFWSNLSTMFDRALIGAQHNIPISTSFNVLKHFQVSPSFNYSEFWLPRRYNYRFNEELGGIQRDTIEGFTRAGVYNVSTGVSTKVFGTFYFNNEKNPKPRIQAIRHMMIPSVGFSYRPDFTRERYGYFQQVETRNANGDAQIQTLSVFEGNAYSVPGGRESGSVNFNLTNNFEMKVKSKTDTVKEYTKVSLLRSLNFSTGYDLIAEEFKLQPVRISGNTSFLNNLISFNFGANLDPYIYRLDSTYYVNGERRVNQTRINEYAWKNGGGLGKIDRANFNISTSLSPSTFKGGAGPANQAPNPNNPNGVTPPTAESTIDEDMAYIYDNPNEYVNFTIPWTLRFNYSFNYSKPGFAESTITQSANFSGDLKITDKWKVGFNSGYDFRNHQFTQTSLSIYRDLHCWQMNVNWIPFGAYQSFSIDINVKSSMLQDLKLSRRRTWMDM